MSHYTNRKLYFASSIFLSRFVYIYINTILLLLKTVRSAIIWNSNQRQIEMIYWHIDPKKRIQWNSKWPESRPRRWRRVDVMDLFAPFFSKHASIFSLSLCQIVLLNPPICVWYIRALWLVSPLACIQWAELLCITRDPLSPQRRGRDWLYGGDLAPFSSSSYYRRRRPRQHTSMHTTSRPFTSSSSARSYSYPLRQQQPDSSPQGYMGGVSAGELLGKTHEELVLLLIQLRRHQSALMAARKHTALERDSQVTWEF